MPLSPSRRGQQPQKSGGGRSIQVNQAFALVILLALLILVALRHLFGSIRVEVGAH